MAFLSWSNENLEYHFDFKGYTHCLNPAIVFTGVNTFDQAWEKRDVKFSSLTTFDAV